MHKEHKGFIHPGLTCLPALVQVNSHRAPTENGGRKSGEGGPTSLRAGPCWC